MHRRRRRRCWYHLDRGVGDFRPENCGMSGDSYFLVVGVRMKLTRDQGEAKLILDEIMLFFRETRGMTLEIGEDELLNQ